MLFFSVHYIILFCTHLGFCVRCFFVCAVPKLHAQITGPKTCNVFLKRESVAVDLESETLLFLQIVDPQTTEDIQNQISELQDYLAIAGCLSPVRKVGDKHIMIRNIFQVPGQSNHLNGMTCSNICFGYTKCLSIFIHLLFCFKDGWMDIFQQKSNIIQMCSTPYFVTGLQR